MNVPRRYGDKSENKKKTDKVLRMTMLTIQITLLRHVSHHLMHFFLLENPYFHRYNFATWAPRLVVGQNEEEVANAAKVSLCVNPVRTERGTQSVRVSLTRRDSKK